MKNYAVNSAWKITCRPDPAVVKGLYHYIRHPQYLALIIASIGMLFIWPRFLVVFGTVTIIFIYIALAKTEERICKRQYPGYEEYMRRTGMFLPRGWLPRLPFAHPASRLGGFAVWAALFIATMGGSVGLALGFRSFAIANFYTVERENQVFLSTVALAGDRLGAIADIALASPLAGAANRAIADGKTLLNYVLPTTMYVSEIPMHLPADETIGHSVPEYWDQSKFKVIFTAAEFSGNGLPEGGNILRHAVNKHPIIEVWVDLATGTATQSYPAPDVPYYRNHQVPLF